MFLDYSFYNFPATDKLFDQYEVSCDWMIFGEQGDFVDIVNMGAGNEDLIIKIPRDKANRLLSLRHKFVNDLKDILNDV